jgi:tRNA-splicing ligase RtcB
MFTYKKENQLPIKSWIPEDQYYADEKMVEQVENLAKLPFAFSHIVLSPDGHVGYGMPIGGVMATKGVIVPNAVGVDIGCGMCAVKTSLTEIDTETLKKIMGEIRKQIPLGMNRHKEKQDETLMPSGLLGDICNQQYNNALCSLGTLGGGNHFIEIQKGSDGHIWIMIHSGSRNLGKQVAEHYNKLAENKNKEWFSSVLPVQELAFLPIDSPEGKDYIREMNYCVEFALANRKLMMDRIINIFGEVLSGGKDYSWGHEEMINIAHNYARMESHCEDCIDNQDNDNPIVEYLSGVEAVSKVQDFLNGYRPVVHSCGGLILSNATSFLKISPLQVDVLEQMSDACRSLNLGLELKHNHLKTSLHLCGCEDLGSFDESYYSSLNKFGLGFSHLFGVEKDFRKWDRILGRIFLGYEAYNLDCKLNNNTSSISHKHNPTQVMIHRKGATLATTDTIGIIPGSMGSKSYIVKGLGNPESFNSCSHGAGRKLGRKNACKVLNLEEENKKMEGIIHGMRSVDDLEEAPGAYKNIQDVMANQSDLVKILVELSPLAVIKG